MDFNLKQQQWQQHQQQQTTQILHLPTNLTLDDPWPWNMTFHLINILKNLDGGFDPSLIVIKLPTFQRRPKQQKPIFSMQLRWPLTLVCDFWPH